MPKSKLPSPARSQGGVATPRRKKPRTSRSLCSPALSTASGRLSSLIDQFKETNRESFALSPLNSRSVLNDNTNIEEPRRKSWWKKLDENSQDVLEVLEDNKMPNSDNVIEDLIDIEVLSQEKKNYTLDLPESSDNESISSIVIPQRKLFTQKEKEPQTKFGQIIGNRETLAKLHKTQNTTNIDKTINAGTKELFQNTRRSKLVFPAALLNLSPNKTTADKTNENVVVEPKPQVRNIFGNRPANKRKNIFADFIVSESEDEIPEIQAKVFGFQKKVEQRRISSVSKGRDHSPTSSITTDMEMDDWKHLPSSTLVENQLEDIMAGQTPVKRARLSKLSEAKESEAGTCTIQTNTTVDKTKQSNKSVSSNNKSKSSTKVKDTSRTTGNMSKHGENVSNSQRQDIVEINKSFNKTAKNKDIEKSLSIADDNIDREKQKNALSKSLKQNKSRTKNSSKIIEKELTCDEYDAIIAMNNETKVVNKSTSKSLSKSTASSKSRSEEKFDANTVQDRSIKSASVAVEQNVPEDDENNFTLEYENDDEAIISDDQKKTLKVSTKKEKTSIIVNKTQDVEINRSQSNKSVQKVPKIVEESQEQHSANDDIDGNIEHGPEKNTDQNQMTEEEQKEKAVSEEYERPKNAVNTAQSGEQNEEQGISQDVNESEHEDNEANLSQNESKEIEDEGNESDKDETNDNEDGDNDENVSEENEDEVDESQENEEAEANESEVEANECEIETNESEVEANESQDTDNKESGDEEIDDANVSQEIEDKSNKSEADEVTDENEEIEGDNHSEVDTNESQEIEVPNENQEIEEDDANDDENINEGSNVNENGIIADDSRDIQNESQENDEESQEIENDDDVNESALGDDQQMEDSDEADKAVASDTDMSEQDNDPSNEMEVDDDDEQQADDAGQEEEQYQNAQNNVEPSAEEIDESPNVTHDTTGRNRKKDHSNKTPEVILQDKTNQMYSFTAKGRNTSVRKTKSMIVKDLNIRPSLASPRNSTGFSDGTRNSSAEGSGWDSHRTTRKTLRQTFGKDFTPRKSLRALVMEKSAKRQTAHLDLQSETVKFPQANSTELPEISNRDVADIEQSDHEISRRTRQTTLEMYLHKMKQQNLEKKLKMEEAVRNSLKAPTRDPLNIFKVPNKPAPRPKLVQNKPKKQAKSIIPFDELPSEFIQDMKYKPPKRFQPTNASWITKRLYKFLENKLEPKYDYKARVRAEKLVETIYHFAKDLRRHQVAPNDAVEVLKHEMARLDIVTTHFEFYEFFHEFMPREVRVKVVPDIVNKIPLPRHGVFSDILRGNTVQG